MHVIARQHSRLRDPLTGIEFSPVLDQVTGTFVAAAEVSDDDAKLFEGREHYEIYDADAFNDRIRLKLPVPQVDPSTGDPLRDAKSRGVKPFKADAKASEDAPPPPPNS